jgi:cytochrome c oxidase cbb3-type subunit III
MKKVALSIITMLSTVLLYAQETAPLKKFWDDPISDPLFPLYVVTSFVVVVIVLVLFVAFYMLRILNMFVQKTAEEKAAKLGVAYAPQPSAWQRLWSKINASVPLEKEESIELDHNYDGIKELDNHLPPWWKWLFYGTISWAIVYLIVYHVMTYLPLSLQEYQNEVAVAKESQLKFKASQPVTTIDEAKLEYANDAVTIERGKTIFNGNCGSCHKNDGGGNIGPNLTDEYWLHGGGIKNIFSTIKIGVPDKGMISWAPVLKPEEIRDVAFYVMSLKGTNPPGAKGPQGALHTEDAMIKTDSIKQASL